MLSDTRDAEIAREEGLAWSQVREKLQAGERLFYRRRESNAGKKAGNIAEWIQTRGPDYAHMIILDADSTMQGDTLVRLAALMEASPRTGIIQTHIVPAGRETLFARALQFSTRMTGAVLTMGTSFWQMSEFELLRPQRDPARRGLRRVLPPAGAVRQAAARRRDPEPRFRRGGLSAPRRLVLLDAARAARQLRGGADQPARLRRARPPLGAGQPAACAADRRDAACTG